MTITQSVGLALLMGCIFTCAGVLQTFWLKSQISKFWSFPLDFGYRLRKRRLFGDNKTFRGFLVWVPSVTLGCWLTGLAISLFHPTWLEPFPWSMDSKDWVRVGFISSVTFLLAELPNSFIKRQLDIPCGGRPDSRYGRKICYVVDQTDSILGGLVGIAFVFPVNVTFCITLFVLGIGLHILFNVLFFLLGMKDRPA